MSQVKNVYYKIRRKHNYCKKLKKSKELQSRMEEELAELHVCNIDLSIELSDIEDEVQHEKFLDSLDNKTLFSFQTKMWKKVFSIHSEIILFIAH